jgi:DNA-binding MarR family transcriptional regulator
MIAPEETLLGSIRALMKGFLIDETRVPPAQGRIKYNAHDFQALAYIAEFSGCTSAQLAKHLAVSPTTAQSVVERLIDRGYLERSQGIQNRRVVSLALTRAGQDVTLAIRQQDLENCRMILEALGEDRSVAFLADLATIAGKFAR